VRELYSCELIEQRTCSDVIDSPLRWHWHQAI